MSMRTATVALLAVALLARLAFIAATPGYVPGHDDRQYDKLACFLLHDGRYSLVGEYPDRDHCPIGAPGHKTAFRPPAYPALLTAVYAVAPTHDRWLWGRIFNALLGVAGAGLLGLIARRLWGARAGLTVLGTAAIAPTLIVFGGSLLTETLFVTLMLASIAAALEARTSPHRLRWLAAAGVLTGLAALTRTNGALLLLPLALIAVPISRRQWRAAVLPVAVLAACTALTIAPWTIRNAIQLHAFIPVADQTGSAFAGTFNPTTRAKFNGAWQIPGRLPEFQDLARRGMSEVEVERELLRRARAYALDHPGYVAEVAVKNTARIFNLGGRRWWLFNISTMSLPGWSGDLSAAGLLLLGILALVAVVTGAARGAPKALWLVPVIMLATTILVSGELRYRAPVDAFIVLLAGLGAQRMLKSTRAGTETLPAASTATSVAR